jgi:hypothetical protein
MGPSFSLVNLYRYNNFGKKTFTSCKAKLKPMHILGPAANGI